MAKEVGIRVTANADPAIRAFDETARTMQAVSRSAKTLTNDGADVEKILEKIGERGGQAFQELIAQQQLEGKSLNEIKKAVVDLASEQQRAARQAKQDYVAEAQAAAILQQRETERRKNLADGLNVLAGRMREWQTTLISAGHEYENLQRQATLAFGDEQIADGVVAAIRNLDDQVQISEQSLLQASVTLQKFGIYSDENLQRAAIAARKTGQSIEEVAAGLGKFERFGDSRSRHSLMKMLGITDEQMNEAGSILDAMDAKFGTTTDGMASNAQLLQGEVGDAMQELGKSVSDAANTIAGAMLPSVQSLHQALGNLSPGVMEAAGAIALSTTAITGIVGAIGTYQLALVTLNEAQLASIATTAKFTLGISAAAAALGLYNLALQTQAQQQANQKAAADLGKDTADAVIEALKAEAEWSGKTAQELIALGVTREQVLRAAEGSKTLGNEANSRSDLEAAKRYLDQADALKQLAIQMGDVARTESQAQEASKKTLDQQREAYKRYQTEVQLGHYKTKDEQQKALEGMVSQTLLAIGSMSESHRKEAMDLVDTLNIAIKRLSDGQKSAVESTAKAASAAASERLRAALDAIEIEDARDGLSHQQKIERLQRVLEITGITADQRIEIEKRVAKEQGSVREEAAKAEEERIAKLAAAAEKARQEKEAAADQLKRKNKELFGETVDEQIAAVEKEAQSYRDKGLDSVEIERYRTGAISKIREDAAAKEKRATEEQNKGLERTNDLLDEQKKKRDALTFKQGGQSIEEAFSGGNFGFTLDRSSELFGKMTTGQEQPRMSAPVIANLSNIDTSSRAVMTVAPSQGGASATSANTIVINAQSVTVNGQARPGAGGAASLEREGFFAK